MFHKQKYTGRYFIKKIVDKNLSFTITINLPLNYCKVANSIVHFFPTVILVAVSFCSHFTYSFR